MGKTKTLKKQKAFSIEDMEPVKLKAGVKTRKHDPAKNLKSSSFINEALLECFLEGDLDAFKEIMRAHYEAVNTTQALRKAGLSKRTFYDAIGPKGNPSISTVMKMVQGLKEA